MVIKSSKVNFVSLTGFYGEIISLSQNSSRKLIKTELMLEKETFVLYVNNCLIWHGLGIGLRAAIMVKTDRRGPLWLPEDQ